MYCYRMDHSENKEYSNGFVSEIEALMKNKMILGGGIGAVSGFVIARQLNLETTGTAVVIGICHLGGHYIVNKYY